MLSAEKLAEKLANMTDDQRKEISDWLDKIPDRKQEPYTDEELANKIITECSGSDHECCHSMADALLTEQLNLLGYPLTVQAFDSLEKWYA